MRIKMTAAEYKQFYHDPKVWRGEAYHEEEIVYVDGEVFDAEEHDVDDIPDTASVIIEDGYLIDVGVGKDGTDVISSYVSVIRAWKKRQSQAKVVVTVDVSRMDEFKSLMKTHKFKVG